MRSGVIGITGVLLALVAVEVAFHLYAATGTSVFARNLASTYLQRDPYNHKAYVSGVVDLVIPAVLLGMALGVFGAAWTPRRLALIAMGLSAVVVGLFPLYTSFFPGGGVRWWSLTGIGASNAPSVGAYLRAYVVSLALCGVFTYGSKILADHFQQRST